MIYSIMPGPLERVYPILKMIVNYTAVGRCLFCMSVMWCEPLENGQGVAACRCRCGGGLLEADGNGENIEIPSDAEFKAAVRMDNSLIPAEESIILVKS